jgi:hypothetical protein
MPELCRFYGLIIRMYFADHNPPHFHAFYGEHEAIIDIRTLAVIGGHLPARALGLVIEWASAHQGELLEAWNKASQGSQPGKITPLS